MVFVAALPVCGWLLAACLSSPATSKPARTSRRRAIRSTSRSCPLLRNKFAPKTREDKGVNGPHPMSDFFAASFLLSSLFPSSFTPSTNRLASTCEQHSAHFDPLKKTHRRKATIAQASDSKLGAHSNSTSGNNSPPKEKRVVVTGMGVVSCLGHDVDTFYDNLLQGKSGITQIDGFDVSSFSTKIAGEIKDFDSNGYVIPKMARRMDKSMLYLISAGKRALEDAGIDEKNVSDLDKAKCGILIGSAMGGMQVFNDAIEALRVSYKKMNPFCIPFVTTNMGSAMLAMDLGWMGPNYSISTACATGNYCILNAYNHIMRGEADMMLAGGSDSAVLPIGIGGFIACRALSKRNEEPHKASRPWDKDRDGFVMGEGAGVILLEELKHAKERGAKIYAEFLGGSFTCDGYHMTEPHPEGLGVHMCIEKALKSCNVNREDVNYVNAHATSTQAGDLQEYKAIARSFGSNPQLKMNSTKSMIGHLLGAAGAIEAVATIQAIKTGWVHPNLNIDNPESIVDMNHLVGSVKENVNIKVALSNSFGFGGHNSSILFAPYS